MANFVYVIGAVSGPQKIGIARDVQKRMKTIQSGSFEPLAIGFCLESPDLAVHIESYAHWLLRDHRMSGEWFKVSPDAAISAVKEAAAAVALGERRAKLVGVVGRKKRWSEDMQARFPEGTFERIEAVLADGEDRTDFVRDAVERELKRREKADR
ncbi:GIY-YIG nuclease family protein [Bradyrhizobium genosp. L]|uniref:GIY-YIG nuclease family protein n=1 Tax=Bradyrhizobium genosp. L TaxID=83637 RepID=UPI0018A2B484|nr:GIY-YIG nuclease family protein [Bradyrhizobium genosp. L]QPF81717.1 GIY-YIG nuclease family protein [Bradyrhizobium genosp. L]QPF87069.1 GIY-YIG nuclease family protein [Bradyrhizobium genosp. L]